MASTPSDERGPAPDDAPHRRPTGGAGPQSSMASWHRMAGVGVEFITSIALFTGLGFLADRWLETQPWLLIIGAGLGFAIGLYSLVRAGSKSFR